MKFPNSLVYLTQNTFVFNNEGKFLTLLRTESAPSRALTWDLPGGAYEKPEDPKESARREIHEEARITVKEINPLTVEKKIGSQGDLWITIVYQTNAIDTEVTLSSEHGAYKWVTPSEFLKLETSEQWKRIVKENLL